METNVFRNKRKSADPHYNPGIPEEPTNMELDLRLTVHDYGLSEQIFGLGLSFKTTDSYS